MTGIHFKEICRRVKYITKKYASEDPAELCRSMDIQIVFKDMGSHETAIKAMMVKFCRIRCIVVNSQLSETVRRFIIAHELGHAVLHADGADEFTERIAFDHSSHMELEANIFASELLIPGENSLIEQMKTTGYTIFQLAAEHMVPYELMAYKLMLMKRNGYDVPDIPHEADSCFLKKIFR